MVWSSGAKQVVAAASRLEPSSGVVEYESVHAGDDDLATVAANAMLIAAAPDLLAACQKAVDDASGATNPAARLPNYEAMQAAVTKATTAPKRTP